MLVSY